MSVLPLIIVLLIVLDKYCFSHILQRPLVACTLLGASLGYLKEGMLLGGALEVYYIAYQSLSEYVPVESGFLFTSIISSFLVSGGVDASITNASAFLVGGIALEYVLNLFNTLFLPAVRKACEKHDDKKVGMVQFALILINVLVYLGVAYFVMNNASSINSHLSIRNDWNHDDCFFNAMYCICNSIKKHGWERPYWCCFTRCCGWLDLSIYDFYCCIWNNSSMHCICFRMV